jgi:hypothetical protein
MQPQLRRSAARTTSTSRHSTPCEWPVPSAFIAASLDAKRPAKCIAGCLRRCAVRDLAFGEDALQEPRAVALDGRDDAGDFGEVDTEADDIWHDQNRETTA